MCFPSLLALMCLCAATGPLNAQSQEPSKTRQFIYVLRLVPRLYSDSNWTKEDNEVLERHFARFQEATKSGQLILAGRTKEPGDKTFGVAIFEASDEAAARMFMQADPAVAGGLMTAGCIPSLLRLNARILALSNPRRSVGRLDGSFGVNGLCRGRNFCRGSNSAISARVEVSKITSLNQCDQERPLFSNPAL